MRRRTLRLKHRLTFQKKSAGQWQDQFTKRGDILYLKAAEAVVAGRLAGKNTAVWTVRYTKSIDAVTSAWRIKDSRGGVFKILSGHRGEDDRFFELTCETGGAN